MKTLVMLGLVLIAVNCQIIAMETVTLVRKESKNKVKDAALKPKTDVETREGVRRTPSGKEIIVALKKITKATNKVPSTEKVNYSGNTEADKNPEKFVQEKKRKKIRKTISKEDFKNFKSGLSVTLETPYNDNSVEEYLTSLPLN